MNQVKVWWLLASSSFANQFGLMSSRRMYQRFDRAGELAGRGPRFFSSHLEGDTSER